MDIRIIPVKINAAGENSFPIARHDEFVTLNAVAYAAPRAVSDTAILEQITGLLAQKDPEHFVIAEIPHPADDQTYYAVAANESAFLPASNTNQWAGPAHVKFGPPPANAPADKKIPTLWTGAMDEEQRIALLASVYTLRAIRLGMPPSEEIVSALVTIAASPSAMAKVMDAKTERSLPPLTPGKSVPPFVDKWKQITRSITKLAIETAQTLRQSEATPAAPTTKGKGQAKSAVGHDPKPV